MTKNRSNLFLLTALQLLVCSSSFNNAYASARSPQAIEALRANATEICGDITSDTTWTLAGSPYIVSCFVTVKGSVGNVARLTIEPGVTVYFANETGMTIGAFAYEGGVIIPYPGELHAVGTAAQPITFTALSGVMGGWEGLDLTSRSEMSWLEHCVVEKAGQGTNYAVECSFASSTIRNTTIRECEGSGLAMGGAGEVDSCTITGNTFHGVTVNGGWVSNSTIMGNGQHGVLVHGGIVSNCTIDSNGREGVSFDTGLVEDCVISNNVGAAVRLTSPTKTPNLVGNVYFGNGEEMIRVPGGWAGATWPYVEGLSYHVLGYLRLAGTSYQAARLTVEPGVTVYFESGAGIRVGVPPRKGELYAVGTEAEPITFTAFNGVPGGWEGFNFTGYIIPPKQRYISSALEHCVVEKAGGGTTAAVRVSINLPTMRNTVIRESASAGLEVYEGSIQVDSCTITGNLGDGVVMNEGTFSNNTIESNGRDGVVMNGGTFSNNTIESNVGDGVVMNGGTFSNNTVDSNVGDGVVMNGGTFLNNTIDSNGRDGVRFSSGLVSDCVISNNTRAAVRLQSVNITPNLMGNVYVGNGEEMIRVPGGTMSEDVVWSDNDGLPYLVEGTITIGNTPSEAARLTVEPGMTIHFSSGVRLIVGYWMQGVDHLGELHAVGTEAEPITFTALSGVPGGWEGLSFVEVSSEGMTTSSLEHCVVEKAGGGTNAAVYCTSTSPPSMRNMVIRESAAAGLELYGLVQVESCTITSNAGTNIKAGAPVSILNSIVTSSATGYGIFTAGGSSPSISCCDVWDNEAGNYGGVLTDLTGVSGNISEDPLFCSSFDDLTLQTGSPCEDGYGCGRMGAFEVGCEKVPVALVFLNGEWDSEEVIVRWRVHDAQAFLGYNIWWADSSDEPHKANDGLISAEMTEYVISGVPRSELRIWMEAVSAEGVFHLGELRVTPSALDLRLDQNHPNPFNPTTTISFSLPQQSPVSLRVYDVRGRLIVTLVDRMLPPGSTEVQWDGTNSQGWEVATGVYFYRLTVGDKVLMKKMVLAR